MTNVVNRVIRKIRGKMPFKPGAVDFLSPQELETLERMLGSALGISQLKESLDSSRSRERQEESIAALQAVVKNPKPLFVERKFTYFPDADTPDEPDNDDISDVRLEVENLLAEKFPAKAPQKTTRSELEAALHETRRTS